MLSTTKTTTAPDVSRGYIYLLGLAILLTILASTIVTMAKKKSQTPKLVN